MRLQSISALLWVAACAPEAAPIVDPPQEEVREPEVYDPDLQVEAPVATLGSDALADAISTSFVDITSYAPVGLIDAIDTMMALADDTCPRGVFEADLGGLSRTTWYDYCYTQDGTLFSGGMDVQVFTDRADGNGGLQNGGNVFAPNLLVVAPDGTTLNVEGAWYWSRVDNDTISTGYASGVGQMYASDSLVGADPWLRGEAGGTFQVFIGDYNGVHVATVNGTLEREGPISGVLFQQVRLEPWRCDAELVGTVSVREANGVWHDVRFATLDDEGTAVGCDGCGSSITDDGSEQSVCPDMSQLDDAVDFTEGLPW